MGEHRIQWIANEGIFSNKIVGAIKNANATFTAAQRKLIEDLMTAQPPSVTELSPPIVPKPT